MLIFRESSYVAVPWKNGGGITREIHREPPGAADFDWRLSLATIDSAGPFSAFAGYERVLVLVRGAGVVLRFEGHGEAHLGAPGEMASFDGAWQTLGEPIDGSCTDLNLMTARSRVAVQSRTLELAMPLAVANGDSETLVCCIRGEVEINTAAGTTDRLQAVDVARCLPSDGTVICRPAGIEVPCLFIAALAPRS